MIGSPLLINDKLYAMDVCREKFNKDGFLKSVMFSPDGSSILAYNEQNKALIYNLNPSFMDQCKYYQNSVDSKMVTGKNTACKFQSSVDVGESIYDIKWYPGMVSGDPSTNCFISTARDHPITLWDTTSGDVRATYSGINHLDELDSALSLTFNLTGDKIYSGSNKMIRCFDITAPGKSSTAIPTAKTRRSVLGQKGIISVISFNPDYSGAYAAGSYAQSIGVYVENSKESVFQIDELGYGVSHLKWSPCGRYLWAGGRHHDAIECWDIRNTGSCVGAVSRPLATNQKMVFDLDPWGQYLATGSQQNEILLYRTDTFELVKSLPCNTDEQYSSGCVHSAVFHPYCAVLLTGSGERTFSVTGCDDSDSDDSCSGDEEQSASRCAKKRKVGHDDRHVMPKTPLQHNSMLCLWAVDFVPIVLPPEVPPATEFDAHGETQLVIGAGAQEDYVEGAVVVAMELGEECRQHSSEPADPVSTAAVAAVIDTTQGVDCTTAVAAGGANILTTYVETTAEDVQSSAVSHCDAIDNTGASNSSSSVGMQSDYHSGDEVTR